jgi:hypothetical protein
MAQKVRLLVYDDSKATVPTIYLMTEREQGVWETR